MFSRSVSTKTKANRNISLEISLKICEQFSIRSIDGIYLSSNVSLQYVWYGMVWYGMVQLLWNDIVS